MAAVSFGAINAPLGKVEAESALRLAVRLTQANAETEAADGRHRPVGARAQSLPDQAPPARIARAGPQSARLPFVRAGDRPPPEGEERNGKRKSEKKNKPGHGRKLKRARMLGDKWPQEKSAELRRFMAAMRALQRASTTAVG